MTIDSQEIGLEHIQALSPLFAHSGFSHPVSTATYYTLLIKNFPTTFNTINKEAKTLLRKEHKRTRLIGGRLELLQHGYIARVLPIEGSINKFERELYLPILPEYVWEENEANIIDVFKKDDLKHKFAKMKELVDIFKKNFGKYGIRTEKNDITLFHSSKWLMYTLVYNIELNDTIRMQLGSLGSFIQPSIKNYERMLSEGLKTKIICDLTEIGIDERIGNIVDLKIKYGDNIKIRSTPTTYGTSRRMIYGNMLVDGKKILSLKNSDLSYISTIYLQNDLINRMQNNFDALWEICDEIQSKLPLSHKPALDTIELK